MIVSSSRSSLAGASEQRPLLFRNVPFKILTADPRMIRFMNVDIWSYLVKSANLAIFGCIRGVCEITLFG